MAKRGLCILLAVLTVFALAVPAFAAETSGKCGDNVKWSLSGTTLTLSGTGATWYYDVPVPWVGAVDQITAVVIGEGVTSISESLFQNCANLTSVTIPDGVTSIGEWAFCGCGLPSVTIPSSVTSMGAHCFEGCTDLESVTLADGLTAVGIYMFCGCTGLTGVTIPASVESIKIAAFLRCTGLSSVTISSGVTSIENAAFYGCTNLTSVTVPASVTSIGMAAFDGDSSLKSIEILNPDCVIDTSDGTALGVPGTTVVSGYAGSTAETYAKENGYTFKALDEKPAKLTAPTVKISQTKSGIQVTWNKVDGAPRYMVYYKENGGGWKKIGTTSKTSYTHAAKKLKNGATYQFTVRCCASDKKTLLSTYKASNSVKYIVELAAPAVKIAQTKSGIQVTWNAVSGSPQYMVYYKENGGKWQQIGTTSKTSYTHAAKKLKNGVTYQFTVRCCASDKKTPLSPYKASNSVKYAVELAAPAVKIAQTKSGIQVTWNAVSGSPQYMVYYKENGGKWQQIGTTSKTSYTHAAKKLKNGVTYQFTVRCCASDKKTLLSPYKASNTLKYK